MGGLKAHFQLLPWKSFVLISVECMVNLKTHENWIDKMKFCEIDDNVYDIHKLQKEKKYENQKTISELKIDGQLFEGTEQVVKGICKKNAG